jgi:hypothetical protein
MKNDVIMQSHRYHNFDDSLSSDCHDYAHSYDDRHDNENNDRRNVNGRMAIGHRQLLEWGSQHSSDSRAEVSESRGRIMIWGESRWQHSSAHPATSGIGKWRESVPQQRRLR